MEIILLDRQEKRIADLDYSLIIDPIEIDDLYGDSRFTFSYPAQESDTRDLVRGNKIAITDILNNWQLYTIASDELVVVEGREVIEVQAENSFNELRVSSLRDFTVTASNASFAVNLALDGTGWQAGNITVAGTRTFTAGLKTPYAALQKIALEWSGELQFRVTVSGSGINQRLVDVVPRRGAFRGKAFSFGYDLQGVTIRTDMEQVNTALYGWGVAEDLDSETGESDRLDFSDVEWIAGVDAELHPGGLTSPAPVTKPLGQKWVGDESARQTYGAWNPTISDFEHRYGEYDSQAHSPEALLWETWRQVEKSKEPLLNVKANVRSLQQVEGFDHERADLGDTNFLVIGYRHFEPDTTAAMLHLNTTTWEDYSAWTTKQIIEESRVSTIAARIIKVSRHRKRPEDTTFEFGNYRPASGVALAELQVFKDRAASRMGLWDRGNFIGAEGELATSQLDGIIDAVNNQIKAGGGSVWLDDDGLWVFDTDTTPLDATAAIRGVAHAGDAALVLGTRTLPTDPWDWRVGMTTDGFRVFGEEIISGKILTDQVIIEGDTYFYWDGNNLHVADPGDLLKQIKLGKYDGTNYGLGFTKDGGSTWQVALNHDGIDADAITAGTIDAGMIDVTNLNADNIVAGTLDVTQVSMTGYYAPSTANAMSTLSITSWNDLPGAIDTMQKVIDNTDEYTDTFTWRDQEGLRARHPGFPENYYWQFDHHGLRYTKDDGTTWYNELRKDGTLKLADGAFLWDGFTLSITGEITVTGGNAATQQYADQAVGSLQDSMGDLAYEDAVQFAKLGTTIISGGYLVTGMIDASRIDTGFLNAARIAAGSITGVKISSTTTITAGSGNNVAVLDGAHATIRLYAGHATATSAPFRVTQAGHLTATNATITGSITSTAGSIGGWTIDTTGIKAGSTNATAKGMLSGNTIAFYAGHLTPGSAPFRVLQNGMTYTKNLQASGDGLRSLSIGVDAESDGDDSVAIGNTALSEGDNSVALGRDAASAGTESVAVGHSSASTGNSSVAVGDAAICTGNRTVAVGVQASATAYQATAVGYLASVEGQSSCAFGAHATAGDQTATALGVSATASGANSTALGRGAQALVDHRIAVGNADVTSIVGYADYTNISDERDKIDIQSSEHGLDIITKLKPLKYKLDPRKRYEEKDDDNKIIKHKKDGSKANKKHSCGFSAQELAIALKDTDLDVVDDNDPEQLGVRSASLIPILVKAVQELAAEVEQLKEGSNDARS